MAIAGDVGVCAVQLQRSKPRLLAEHARGDLIDRDTVMKPGAPLKPVCSGQPKRAPPVSFLVYSSDSP